MHNLVTTYKCHLLPQVAFCDPKALVRHLSGDELHGARRRGGAELASPGTPSRKQTELNIAVRAQGAFPTQTGPWQTRESLQKWCGDKRKRCEKKRTPEFEVSMNAGGGRSQSALVT